MAKQATAYQHGPRRAPPTAIAYYPPLSGHVFTKAYENKAVATLRGDRGTTMLCRFNLDAGGAGMGGGGSRECQSSKGARTSARFECPSGQYHRWCRG